MEILFVDDEQRWVTSYIDELKYAGFTVHYKSTVDSAMEFFDDNHDQLSLLILDIMMPPGSIFKFEETQDGLRAGVLFYDTIRMKNPSLPVIILTNVSDDKVKKKFEQEYNCLFLRKPECFPYELAEEVRSILS